MYLTIVRTHFVIGYGYLTIGYGFTIRIHMYMNINLMGTYQTNLIMKIRMFIKEVVHVNDLELPMV
jgi:GH24 family phage-related lysozyme (muramidase)